MRTPRVAAMGGAARPTATVTLARFPFSPQDWV